MNVTGITLNRIIEEFSQIQQAHLQLESFHYGNFLKIYQSDKVNYKSLLMNVNNASMDENFIILQIEFMVMDKVFKDLDDRDDVESDCLEILQDIYSVVSYSNRWQSFSKVSQSSTMRKFYNKGEDQVTGWAMQLNLNIKRKNGICDLPIDDYDYDGDYAPFCAGVRIFEDDILIEVVASGGRYDYSTGGGDPVQNSMNGTGLTEAVSGTTKTFVITYADLTSVVVTTTSDSATAFVGTVPNPVLAYNSGTINKTGIDASARSGDDFALSRGRGTTFWDLDFTNPYLANDKAYTGTTGGYYDESLLSYHDVDGTVTTEALAFPNGLIVNWKTLDTTTGEVFCMDSNFLQSGTNAAMITGAPYTRGGFTGFYVCNIMEYYSFFQFGGSAFGFNWLPLNFNIGTSATTRVASSTPSGTSLFTLVSEVQTNALNSVNAYTTFVGRYLNAVTDLGL